MLPGMNQRKMQQVMRRMGINQVEIPATEVIIKTADKEIIISDPDVSKVNMMGQETFQISGTITEKEISTTPEINDEDIKTVMEQAEVDKETAKKALESSNGDIAKAILELKQQII